MLLENVKLPAIQPFTSSYIKQDDIVKSFFHYGYNEQDAFNARMKELKERSFNRAELADCIEAYMGNFPGSDEVNESLNKLKDDGLAVIGGQQAGLLTGPLYSIHKIISIIHLAKIQEEKLNTPVIPVFWIAGEDHDFLEINHVLIESDGEMKKKGYPELVTDKRMASLIKFDPDEMKKWVRSIIREFGESSHTSNLLLKLDKAIANTTTITSFFSYIVMEMFKDEGLLIIDAAYPSLRKLEVSFFKELLINSKSITESVKKQQRMIQDQGYKNMIDIEGNAVNLFLNIENERVLLFKTSKGYEDKQGIYQFTENELLKLMEQSPEIWSNNVVTRPMMQEWLFPSLAFIAGPGEIAYWAELRKAFEKMKLTIPPIVPRLTLTLVEKDVKQKLKELKLDLTDVLKNGVENQKKEFLLSVSDEELDGYIEETQNWLDQQYNKIQQKAELLHPGLPQIVTKNLSIHQKQLSYLKKKSDDYLTTKHQTTLRKFDRIQTSLRPLNGPQERSWNLFYFLNKYGDGFIRDLMQTDLQFDDDHKVFYV